MPAHLRQRRCVRRVGYLRHLVHDGEDALGARDRRLEGCVEHRDLVERAGEVARVVDEGRHYADGGPVAQHHPAADARQQREGHVPHQPHRGPHQPAEDPRRRAGGPKRDVRVIELGNCGALAAAYLHHLLSTDGLLDDPVEPPEVALPVAIVYARAVGDKTRDREGQRQRHQHHQRQLPAKQEHGHERPGDRERAADQACHRIPKCRADSLGVVGQAAHQLAVRVPVEEA